MSLISTPIDVNWTVVCENRSTRYVWLYVFSRGGAVQWTDENNGMSGRGTWKLSGDTLTTRWNNSTTVETWTVPIDSNGWTGTCTMKGLQYSLNAKARNVIQAPLGEDTPDQQTALVIADTIEKGGSGMWAYISPQDLAESLRERIRVPTKINQATMPHCGPAALAYDLAGNNPRLYAETIRGLYRNGYAYLPGSGRIAASDTLRNVNYNQFFGVRSRTSDHPEADWILLSSIRNTESWANVYWGTSTLLGWASGMTLPSTFETWLKNFGYTRTVNVTNLVVSKGIPELREASRLFETGWRVFLFVNRKVLTAATQTGRSASADHYIALTSKVTFDSVVKTGGFLSDDAMLSDEYVSFVCASWGQSKRVPADANNRLKGLEFCRNFYGYVAAVN